MKDRAAPVGAGAEVVAAVVLAGVAAASAGAAAEEVAAVEKVVAKIQRAARETASFLKQRIFGRSFIWRSERCYKYKE